MYLESGRSLSSSCSWPDLRKFADPLQAPCVGVGSPPKSSLIYNAAQQLPPVFRYLTSISAPPPPPPPPPWLPVPLPQQTCQAHRTCRRRLVHAHPPSSSLKILQMTRTSTLSSNTRPMAPGPAKSQSIPTK
ncbi:hypothetical protein L226DRAFT_372356 [Lentinus tigrinus ALCF2SS1-7]|uniref:Uncharacterized protein n=1 Tax=Lentinus tigrinus ALCF2SS1-6 TaxID=1328759 RepID=A0A5C2SLD4_9APHY|nr:hypothetical protein L227DRAFT_317591 [Lentinus tigrinus ALCF2SS1-6]RPD76294.1 hypothetical protein L226DRAFT_372356 [Lentinus tigrinus ALCF2SS1-7]